MALKADQIRANLASFAARWSIGEWGERKEAQTYLNELFTCFGMDRREVAEFEHFEAGGFFDLVWPGICLIEMKASKEKDRLAQHRVQAMTYGWPASVAANRPEIRARLAELHRRISAGELSYSPFLTDAATGAERAAYIEALDDVRPGERLVVRLTGGDSLEGELSAFEDGVLILLTDTGERSIELSEVNRFSSAFATDPPE